MKKLIIIILIAVICYATYYFINNKEVINEMEENTTGEVLSNEITTTMESTIRLVLSNIEAEIVPKQILGSPYDKEGDCMHNYGLDSLRFESCVYKYDEKNNIYTVTLKGKGYYKNIEMVAVKENGNVSVTYNENK